MVVSVVALTRTRLEEKALGASLMKRMSHGSMPSSSPSTTWWLPLPDFEAPARGLMLPSLQIIKQSLYEGDSFPLGSI